MIIPRDKYFEVHRRFLDINMSFKEFLIHQGVLNINMSFIFIEDP